MVKKGEKGLKTCSFCKLEQLIQMKINDIWLNFLYNLDYKLPIYGHFAPASTLLDLIAFISRIQ